VTAFDHISRRGFLSLLGALPLAACGRSESVQESAAAEEGPAYGDTLVQASIGDISGLIPNITSDSASHEIGGLIYSNLIRTDKELRPEGSWRRVETSHGRDDHHIPCAQGRQVARRG
jgi:ABC-type transport system substrate-binding protein